jgi:hypothetical protein
MKDLELAGRIPIKRKYTVVFLQWLIICRIVPSQFLLLGRSIAEEEAKIRSWAPRTCHRYHASLRQSPPSLERAGYIATVSFGRAREAIEGGREDIVGDP